MDQHSIERMTRHIKDVPRIEANFADLDQDEIDKLLNEHVAYASTRWEQCNRSFRMLFMGLNRGNKLPVDSFNIRIGQEQIGDKTIDTFVRIWRDRRNNSFNVKPFTRNGRIEDHEFETERFEDTFYYRYGTYRSKSVKLEVDHDAPDPIIRLTRVEGKLIDEMTTATKAVYLSALDDVVTPMLENTEETLEFVCQCVLDPGLNPDHARKLHLDHL